MAEIGGLVAPFAFVYGAALAGTLAALLVRIGTRRAGRTPTLLEATGGAFLPLATVLLVALVAVLQPHPVAPFDAAHAGWHRWEAAMHRSPLIHALLDGANWLVLVGSGLAAARTVFSWSRMRSFETTLNTIARRGSEAPYATIASDRPSSFTLGLLQPRVYITTSLLDQLSPRDLEAVLAHEAAHVRRRDTLTSAFLTLFYTLLPLPGSRLLLHDWRLAVERACDHEAARMIGSRSDVAMALVRVARLITQPTTVQPHAAGFSEWGEDVEGRVQALIQPPAPARQSGMAVGGLATVSMGLLCAATNWLPHMVDLFAHH